MELKTKSGLTYHLDEEMLGDLEIFENIVAIQKGDPTSLPETIRTLIGDDGYDQLKEACRNEKGRVPTDAFVAGFGELMELAGKKSGKKK